jgi:hypothetical protein
LWSPHPPQKERSASIAAVPLAARVGR